MSRIVVAVVLSAAVGARLSSQTEKPPTLDQVLAKTAKQKQYSFTISGGAGAIEGEVERGAVHYRSGAVEVAGKSTITHAKVEGKWVSAVSAAASGDESLRRLVRLAQPHLIVVAVAREMAAVQGDGIVGFRGEIGPPRSAAFAKEPWVDLPELQGAKDLRAQIALAVSEGIVSKMSVSLSGTKTEDRRTDQRVNDNRGNRGGQGGMGGGGSPPRPPKPNWVAGSDGYWHELIDVPVSASVKIEFSGWGTARLSQEVREKLGIKDKP